MHHFSYNPVYNTGENTGKNIKKQYIEVFVFLICSKKARKYKYGQNIKKAYFLTKQENYHFLFGYKISRLRKIMDNMMKNKKIGKIPKNGDFWENREIGENSEFWDFGGNG